MNYSEIIFVLMEMRCDDFLNTLLNCRLGPNQNYNDLYYDDRSYAYGIIILRIFVTKYSNRIDIKICNNVKYTELGPITTETLQKFYHLTLLRCLILLLKLRRIFL
ncbi:hypothetical protein HZS_297 [Henneguya salminicola]|nr:hypothetical protein HZS_297 [Henneguya salminicola]